MLKSKKPVISVCAVRTGCGKSAITRFIAGVIKKCDKTPVVIRHPMPYGDLKNKNSSALKPRKTWLAPKPR